MDQDSEKPKSGIKVVDRRRFDSAGTEKTYVLIGSDGSIPLKVTVTLKSD